jgi:hypothetical protein
MRRKPYSEDEIREIASQYKTKRDLEIAKKGVYLAAFRRHPGLLDEIYGKSVRWTMDALTAEGAKYKSLGEFGKKNPSAYKAAYQLGVLDLVCKRSNTRWTKEKVIAESKKFQSRSKFMRGSGAAYQYALKHCFIDELYGVDRRQYTEEEVMTLASKFSSVKDFKDSAPSAVGAAFRLGIYARATAHMKRLSADRMDPEKVKQLAMSYTERKKFRVEQHSAYAWICVNGFLDEWCGHMISGKADPEKPTLVYIWKAVGLFYNDVQVYKIGITSKALGVSRIKKVASRHNMKYEVITIADVGSSARRLERMALNIGNRIEYDKVADGFTEFRALTDGDLSVVLEAIEAAAFFDVEAGA